VASPDAANVRSIRALQKAGFTPMKQISLPTEPGRQQLLVLDRRKFFG
jgi:RimJ/RimL family protein N-acetyltransferase